MKIVILILFLILGGQAFSLLSMSIIVAVRFSHMTFIMLSSFFLFLVCWVFLLWTIDLLKDFPGTSAGKESACNTGGHVLIPGLWRYPEEGNGYPLQYSFFFVSYMVFYMFLTREFRGQRNLAGYSPWDWKKLDTTEQLSIAQHWFIQMIFLCNWDNYVVIFQFSQFGELHWFIFLYWRNILAF